MSTYLKENVYEKTSNFTCESNPNRGVHTDRISGILSSQIKLYLTSILEKGDRRILKQNDFSERKIIDDSNKKKQPYDKIMY